MKLETRSASSLAEANPFQSLEDGRYGTLSVFELKNLPANWPDTLNKRPVRFHKITPGEAALLQTAQEKSGQYLPGDVARRLAAGREAFVGEVVTPLGALMVTYGWVALTAEPMGATGCSFAPPPGDAYLYDFATVPEFRGNGFYPALLRYILGELGGRGIRRVWIGTAPGNFASAHSIRRAGFSKVADTRFVPAKPGRAAAFELVEDARFDPALREVAGRAYVSNRA